MLGPLKILAPYSQFVPLLFRIAIGVNFFVGRGVSQLIIERNQLLERWKGNGIPPAVTFSAGLLNFFGALFLIVGFMVPVVAFLFVIEMMITSLIQKFKFRTSYFGHGKPGYELNVVYLSLSFILIVLGAGSPSVDSTIGM